MTHDYKTALDWFNKANWDDRVDAVHAIRSALQLAQEAEKIRKERDELVALVIKAQENNDVLAAREAVVLAKKVNENGNA